MCGFSQIQFISSSLMVGIDTTTDGVLSVDEGNEADIADTGVDGTDAGDEDCL